MAKKETAKPDAKAEAALRLHAQYKGKIQILPKCPVSGLADFAIWYTPGVAAPCLDIAAHPERVYEHTNKANSVAIVSDGTRVLGLGNIGPEAGLPVMEGKALLFKYLGGVDAVPLCVATADADELVRVTKALEPGFGGINLEDISQPKCFRVLDALRDSMNIPVWHDDQQGSATAMLAGLLNALAVVGKKLADAKIAMIGVGAANVACYRLLSAAGAAKGAIVACDSRGTLHQGRGDIEAARDEFPDKWRICRETNAEAVAGGIAAAMRGADVCLAFSTPGPGVIAREDVAGMAKDAIVFACANPVPEIWPEEARAAGAAIVATGRSDFPNQVNNSLVFPGLFRGVLDVRARRITDEMAMAAAHALADCARERGIGAEKILPRMDEWEVAARVAAATAMKAQDQGLARLAKGKDEIYSEALAKIAAAREATAALMREGLIAARTA
jgi:malate dehydrogenase (oxaloacetate-decarboxylating)